MKCPVFSNEGSFSCSVGNGLGQDGKENGSLLGGHICPGERWQCLDKGGACEKWSHSDSVLTGAEESADGLVIQNERAGAAERER